MKTVEMKFASGKRGIARIADNGEVQTQVVIFCGRAFVRDYIRGKFADSFTEVKAERVRQLDVKSPVRG